MRFNKMNMQGVESSSSNYNPWGRDMAMQGQNNTLMKEDNRISSGYARVQREDAYPSAYKSNSYYDASSQNDVYYGTVYGENSYNKGTYQPNNNYQYSDYCKCTNCYQSNKCGCGCSSHIKGITAIQLQLININTIQIESNTNVIFDEVLIQTSDCIRYDKKTGDIEIVQSGTYYFSWWVEVDGIMGGNDEYVAFAIKTLQGQKVNASSYNTSGQLVGSAVLKLNVCQCVPMKLSLINSTDGTIGIGGPPIKANLIIMKLTES